jgi:hypothetical protein
MKYSPCPSGRYLRRTRLPFIGEACRLNLSEHTVKNCVFRIFDKVGVSNRIELVLYALSSSKRAEMLTSSDNAPANVAAHSRES